MGSAPIATPTMTTLLGPVLAILLGAAVPQQSPAPGHPALETVSRGEVTVHYATPDSARAGRILRFLLDQPPLPALPAALPRDVHVYLAPNQAVFDSLTGGRVPEWGAGVALPGTRSMVIPAWGERRTTGWDEARLLRHEWAHLGLHQHLEGLQIPRWFNEGYAEWASGGWNADEGWRLRIALVRGGPDMDSLALRWPRERTQARVAYMLAGTAVEYLTRASGARGLELLLERWREEGTFSRALRGVYGVTPGQFEEDWRSYVKDRYGWLFVLSHSAVFWLFLTLLLLVMVWIRRRRDREAMARLRASDPPDRPGFWREGFPSEEEPGGGERGPISTRGGRSASQRPFRLGGTGPASRGPSADAGPDDEPPGDDPTS